MLLLLLLRPLLLPNYCHTSTIAMPRVHVDNDHDDNNNNNNLSNNKKATTRTTTKNNKDLRALVKKK